MNKLENFKDDLLESDILDVLNKRKPDNSMVDMTIPNSPTDKRNFDSYFKLNNWCDARDQLKIWRLGKIKKITGNFVCVGFDGWSEKWDQWYCIHSEEILPVRYETTGYTGQRSIALREFDFESSLVETATSKLKLLTANDNLTGFPPFDLTSFIRGDLFVLVDCIMTNGNYVFLSKKQKSLSISKLETKDIAMIFQQFFIQIILFALKWMAVTKRNLQNNQIDMDDPEAYLKYHPCACFKCGYELTLILRSIFGFEKRTQAFYEINNFSTSPKGLIFMFLNNNGLQNLIELMDVNDLRSQKPIPKIDFLLIWPLIYSIPFFFENNTSYYSYYPGQIKNYILTLTTYMRAHLEQNLISYEFFGEISFKTFLKSIGKLISIYSTENPLEKLLEDFNVPYEKDATIKKPPEDGSDMRKLQTNEHINFSKDLFNLKSSLFRQVKRDSISSLQMPKVSPEKLKALENEIESLKNQIKQMQISISEQKEKEIAPKLPDGFEKTLRMLTKFNDIIEDHLVHEGPNKILKEFESGSVEIKEIGASLIEIISEQKGVDKNSTEVGILMGVEMLLGENRIEETLKLVRWRKKIIKLMEVCGWEVANEISRQTMKKLDVEVDDVIRANLEMAMRNKDNFLSYFIENKTEEK